MLQKLPGHFDATFMKTRNNSLLLNYEHQHKHNNTETSIIDEALNTCVQESCYNFSPQFHPKATKRFTTGSSLQG